MVNACLKRLRSTYIPSGWPRVLGEKALTFSKFYLPFLNNECVNQYRDMLHNLERESQNNPVIY